MSRSRTPRRGDTPRSGVRSPRNPRDSNAGSSQVRLEVDFDPVPGSPDRGVLLAHGAGSDRRAPAISAVAQRLAAAGVPSLRFDYPYRSAGRRAPDRPPVLEAATRAAARTLAERTGLPPGRLVLGGRSMGGRYCSLVVGAEEDPVPALGLLLLAYPLHSSRGHPVPRPAGSPDVLRTAHFPRLRLPVLFVSGDRDTFARREALQEAAVALPGPVTFHWLEGADHGYRVPRGTGRAPADVLAEVAEVSAAWVASLPGTTGAPRTPGHH